MRKGDPIPDNWDVEGQPEPKQQATSGARFDPESEQPKRAKATKPS